MSIRSILVAYSGDAGGSGGLRLAILMARKYGAHLTGVVSHGPTYLEREYSRYMNADVLSIVRARDDEAVARIRAEFEARVAAEAPGVGASFLDLNARRGFTLADCARTYDILVMGRRASEPGREHFGERPDEIALACGRPVLLVPNDYDRDSINEHALVAWDGKRASARALGDAMHILQTKDRVTVLSVGDSGDDRSHGDTVMTLLDRHGVKASRLVRPAGGQPVARVILDTCAEVGAGLLVMGAYEHNRTMEAIFGGVTHDIMQDAPLPVLMSH